MCANYEKSSGYHQLKSHVKIIRASRVIHKSHRNKGLPAPGELSVPDGTSNRVLVPTRLRGCIQSKEKMAAHRVDPNVIYLVTMVTPEDTNTQSHRCISHSTTVLNY